MRRFRFRAQAALDLRRREHDRALVILAQAQTAVSAAAAAVLRADAAVRRAESELAAAMQSAPGQLPLDWYRSWRLRCVADRAQHEQHQRACEADVQRAADAAAEIRRKVRSLERLHDNSLAAWRVAAQQEEQKTMDALAAVNFVRRKEAV